jgi:hypothetical protein
LDNYLVIAILMSKVVLVVTKHIVLVQVLDIMGVTNLQVFMEILFFKF